jgi:hypothetical protein
MNSLVMWSGFEVIAGEPDLGGGFGYVILVTDDAIVEDVKVCCFQISIDPYLLKLFCFVNIGLCCYLSVAFHD